MAGYQAPSPVQGRTQALGPNGAKRETMNLKCGHTTTNDWQTATSRYSKDPICPDCGLFEALAKKPYHQKPMAWDYHEDLAAWAN